MVLPLPLAAPLLCAVLREPAMGEMSRMRSLGKFQFLDSLTCQPRCEGAQESTDQHQNCSSNKQPRPKAGRTRGSGRQTRALSRQDTARTLPGHHRTPVGHHRTPAGHLQNSPCLGAMTKALRCLEPCPGQGQQLPCIWG